MKSLLRTGSALLTATLAMALSLGAASWPTPAAAATGNTAFKIILQPTVIVDYYKEIDLTIPPAALAALVGTGTNVTTTQAITATAAGALLSANAAIASTSNAINAVSLDIQNAFTVRTLSSSTGTTTVGVQFSNGTAAATLTGVVNTASTIPLSNLSSGLTTFTASTGLAGANAKPGDFAMTLDLSKATNADTYAGATIVVTATTT